MGLGRLPCRFINLAREALPLDLDWLAQRYVNEREAPERQPLSQEQPPEC